MKRYFTCALLLGFFIWLPNAFANNNGVLSLDAPTHVRQLQNNSDGVLLTLRVNNIQVQASWRVSNAVTAFGIDEDRGVLSLSAEAQAGKLVATVYVEDEFSRLNSAYANLTASAVISVEILSGLVLSGLPRLTVVAGEVVHTLSVSGASGAKTYGVFGGDGYFVVDELSDVLSVSGDAAAGSYTLTIEVMDDNATVQVLATVAVLAILELAEVSNLSVVVGMATGFYTVVASGGIDNKTYTLIAGNEDYFSVDAESGVLSVWSSVTVGIYTLLVEVSDGRSQATAMAVVEVVSSLSLVAVPRLVAVAGEEGNLHTLMVSGGIGAKTYTLVSGDNDYFVLGDNGVLFLSSSIGEGLYTLTLGVIDGRGYMVESVATVEVSAALMLADAPPVTVIASVAMSLHTFMASGGIGVKTYTLVMRDDNYFSVNATSGVLSLSVGIAVGLHTVTVQAIDMDNRTVDGLATVGVSAALELADAPRLSVATETDAGFYTFVAEGGIGSKTYTIIAGEDAEHFSLGASNGVLSLSGASVRVYTLSIQATDSRGHVASALATVAVLSLYLADVLTLSVIEGREEKVHTFMVDGGGGYTYTLVSGNDDYFSIGAGSGVLSVWSSVTVGIYTLRVEVSDGNSQDTAMAVVDVRSSLSLFGVPRVTVVVGEVAYTLSASGGIGARTYTLAGDAANFVLGETSGLLSLSVGAKEGLYTLTLGVIDGRDNAATAWATVEVSAALMLADAPPVMVIASVAMSLHTFEASGGIGVKTYTLVARDDHYFSVNATSGVLSLSVGVSVGLYTVTVRAIDTGNRTVDSLATVGVSAALLLVDAPRLSVAVNTTAGFHTFVAEGGIGSKTYTIIAGDGAQHFNIGTSNGVLSLVGAAVGVYTLSIQATDSRGHVALVLATVDVLSLSLADVPPLFYAIEGKAESLYTLVANSAEATYTIVSGNEDNYFTLGVDSGILSLLATAPIGSYTLSVAASDGSNSAGALVVVSVVSSLSLSAVPRVTVVVGDVVHTLSASGGIGDKTYTLLAGDESFAIDAVNGILSLSADGQEGLSTLTLGVVDERGNMAQGMATVVVSAALMLSGAPPLTIIASVAMSLHTFTASGGIGVKTYMLAGGGDGYFAIDVINGVLSLSVNTPPKLYKVTVQAIDRRNNIAHAVATVGVSTRLTLADASPRLFGGVGTTVSLHTFMASGGIGVKTYTIVLGNEDRYFNLGVMSGVLSLTGNATVGLYTLSVQVRDSRGHVALALATVEVLSLYLASPSRLSVIEGRATNLYTLEAIGGLGGDSYTIIAGNESEYFVLNATSGVLSVLSSVTVGVYPLSVAVSDDEDNRATALVIVEVVLSLSLSEVPPLTVLVGDAVYTLSASGGIGDKTYTLVAGHRDYFSLDETNGGLSVKEVGLYTLTLRVIDGRGNMVQGVATVEISAALVLATVPSFTVIASVAMSLHTFEASGGIGSKTYTLVAHDDNYFSVNATSGVLSLASNTPPKIYTLSLVVLDMHQNQVRAMITVDVRAALSLGAPLLFVLVGEAKDIYTLRASGGIGAKNYNLEGDTEYFVLAADGVLSVQGSIMVGKYTLSVVVLDDAGQAGAVVTVEIRPTLSLAEIPLLAINGVVEKIYTLTARGGIGDYTYSLVSINGFTLSDDGVLSSEGSEAGSYTLTVWVADGRGGQAQAMVRVEVASLILTDAPLLTVLLGHMVSLHVFTAYGGGGDKIYTLLDGPAVQYFSLDEVSGVLSITGFASVGVYTLSVVVTSGGNQAEASALVEVVSSLSIMALPPLVVVTGVAMDIYTLMVSGGVGAKTYTLATGNDAGYFVLAVAQGILSVKAGITAGIYTLSLGVIDAWDYEVYALVTITALLPLLLSDVPLLSVVVGEGKSFYQITAFGGGEKTYRIVPEHEYFVLDEESGVLSVLASVSVGVYTLSLQVDDGHNRALALATVEAVWPLSLVSVPFLTVATGEASVYTFVAVHGIGAKAYTIRSGQGTQYFVLNETSGVLSVLSSVSLGIYTLSVAVQDEGGYTVQAEVMVTVFPFLSFTGVSLVAFAKLSREVHEFVSSGGIGAKSYAVVSGNEGGYFVLGAESGVLSVMRAKEGRYNLSVEVRDSAVLPNRVTVLAVVEVLSNQIFVLGGNDGGTTVTNDVWSSSDGEEWFRWRDADWSARDGHQVVVHQGRLYMLGGYDGDDYKNDVWSSVDGHQWLLETDQPGWSGRSGHQAVSHQGRLYVLGGATSLFNNIANNIADVWSSVDGKQWTLETGAPGWQARNGHQAVSYQGRLYVLGGLGGLYRNDVWSSEDGKNWYLVTLNVGFVYGHQAVVSQEKMYVLGGFDSDGNKNNDVWSSTDGKNWRKDTTAGGRWSVRTGHQALSYDGQLYVLGGDGSNLLNDVWSSADGENWSLVENPAGWTARSEHQAVVFPPPLFLEGVQLNITVGVPSPSLHTFVAHYGLGNYTYSLPPTAGFDVSSDDGVLSTDGEVNEGEYVLTIWVEDEEEMRAKTIARINVSAFVVPTVHLSVVVGRTVNLHTITAIGGIGNKRYELAAGHEEYFMLAEEGALSALGQASVGVYTLSVVARDDNNNIATGAAVVEVVLSLSLASESSLLALADSSSTVHTFAAIGGVSSRMYSIVGGVGANYFVLGEESGRLLAENAEVGYYTVLVAVRDSDQPPNHITVTAEVHIARNIMFVLGGGAGDGANGLRNDVWSSGDSKNWRLVTMSAGWPAREGHQAVVHNDRFYVVGGNKSGGLDNGVWSSVDGVNWSLMEGNNPRFTPRWYHQVVSHQGRLYVAGGLDGTGYVNRRNDVWSSVDGKEWSEVTAAAGWLRRNFHQMVSHQGRLYVLGGQTYIGNRHPYLDDVWSSVDGAMWNRVAVSTGWGKRDAPQVVSHQGKLYLLGGRIRESGSDRGAWNRRNDVWSSVDGETWSEVKGHDANVGWSPRVDHQAVSRNGLLYVMGGDDGVRRNDVWSSRDGVAWTREKENAEWTPRDYHQAVVFPPSLLLEGGGEDLRFIIGFSAPELYTVVARYGDGHYTYSLSSRPSGFAINNNNKGVLSVVDVVAGDYTVTVWVEDGEGVRAQTTVPVVVVSLFLADAQILVRHGDAVSLHMFTALGGVGTITYNIIAGDEDDYFDVAEHKGVLSVSADAPAGNYDLTIQAQDEVGNVVYAQALVHLVSSLSLASTISLAAIAELTMRVHTVMPQGGIGPKVYTLVAGHEDGYFTLDSATGALSVINAAVGRYTMSLVVWDRDLTVNRATAAVVVTVVRNMMLVLGGRDNDRKSLNDVWSSVDGQHWLHHADADWDERQIYQVVVHQGRLYVLGGYTNSPDDTYYNDVWSSVNGQNWSLVLADGHDYWTPRNNPQVVSHNGLLYVLGGFSPGTYHNDVWSSADGRAWTRVLQDAGWQPRIGHRAVSHNGLLYVLGGDEGSEKNDVWSSVDGASWQQVNSTVKIYEARHYHQVVSYQGLLYVLGGYSYPRRSQFDDVWSSSDGINWTKDNSNTFDPVRDSHEVLEYQGQLYVLGGRTGSAMGLNDVWSWSGGEDWTQNTPAANWPARYYFQAAVFPPELLLEGVNGLHVITGRANDNLHRFKAYYGEGDYTYSLPAQVSGFSLSKSGILATDGNVATGQHMLTVAVQDEDGNKASAQVLVKAISPLSLAPIPSLTTFVRLTVSVHTFMPQGGIGPKVYTLVAGNEQGYFSVTPAGVLSVSNAVKGDYTLSMVVWDRDVPSNRATATVVVMARSMIFVLGGRETGQPAWVLSLRDDVWSSADGKNWSRQPDASSSWGMRYGHQVVVHRDRLYMLGGFRGGSGAPNVANGYNNAVWSSVDGQTWTLVLADGHNYWGGRLGHQAVSYNGSLYVLGGWSFLTDYLNDVWSSVDGREWTLRSRNASWSKRWFHQAVSHNGRLYVLGGCDGYNEGRLKNDVWSSVDGVSWSETDATNGYSTREGHQVVSRNGRLYVLGGYGESDCTNGNYARGGDIWYSDDDGSSWMKSTSVIDPPRAYHQAVMHQGQIYILGGRGENEDLNDVWSSSDFTTWSRSSAPWSGRYSHQAVVFPPALE